MHVHRSNRVEELVSALAEVVRVPAGGALERELIVVQSKGMERWLGMELSKRLGVWANARFPFPRALIEELFRAVVGRDHAVDAFARDNLVWSVAALLPGVATRPGGAPVAAYLADDPDDLKRFELATRVAYVFDQYAVYRPELVGGWLQGGDRDLWQAELWRALVAKHGAGHVAARAARFLEAWRGSGPLPPGIPRRIGIFGVSSLPPLYVDLLAAVSTRVEVHLFQLAPSREYWAEIRSEREQLRAAARAGADEAHAAVDNPLLASLGRAGRDFQRILEAGVDYEESDADLFRDPGTGPVLQTLQSDILAQRKRGTGPGDAPPLPLAASDASIRIHSCHSPMREVEVLRDQLLGLFEADAALEPRDVLVMTPDIDAYAPLLDAVFGVDPRDPGFIPHRIADRAERASSAVADAFLMALALVRSRMKASEVLDLLELEPVRARFGITADEVEQLERWIREAGVRWGVDERDRAEHGQPALAANTWRFGFERLLLGYALPDRMNMLFEGRLPLADVEGTPADGIGRVIDLCERLFAWRERLAETRTLDRWRDDLGALLDDLCAVPEREAYRLQTVRDALAALAERAAAAGFTGAVGVELVQRLVADHFDAERGAHEFLSGGVTFCALLPMRSIPFKVVVLLGMSDDGFPRRSHAPDFDLIAANPRPGDRSLRDEDRYLFLEALLSARQHLVVCYVGRGVRDNEARPPSVVVGELLDAIDDSFRIDGAARPSATLSTEHPLQPFSPRYFDGSSSLFSYAGAEVLGARALTRRSGVTAPFQLRALPALESATVDLDKLARFFENPARGLVRDRLGVDLSDDATLIKDREPIEIDPLERWHIGDELFERVLDGQQLSSVRELSRAGGELPLGMPGAIFFDELAEQVQSVADASMRWLVGEKLGPIAIDLDVGCARIIGSLRAVWPLAQVHRQYSRLKPKHELSMWVRHLVLSCVAPRESVVVGRTATGDAPFAESRFRVVPAEEAKACLAGLVELYRLGTRAPLGLFPSASKAFVRALPEGRDAALDLARECFDPPEHGRAFPESSEAYVAQCFGGVDPLSPTFRAVPDLELPGFEAVSRAVFEPFFRYLVQPAAADAETDA